MVSHVTNVERIESFLKKIMMDHGKDPSDEESVATKKLQSLLEVIHVMSFRIGDSRMNEFFRNVLVSLVTEAPEGKAKDTYMLALNQFNKEINAQLN